jgi:hypothetical protein
VAALLLGANLAAASSANERAPHKEVETQAAATAGNRHTDSANAGQGDSSPDW